MTKETEITIVNEEEDSEQSEHEESMDIVSFADKKETDVKFAGYQS